MIRSRVCCVLALPFLGCGDDVTEPLPPFETLSEYGYFEEPLADMRPIDGVVPYVPVSPLWADHARKSRFIALPDGTRIAPDGDEDWAYPLGTVVIKNFYFGGGAPDEDAQLVETRLLIREDVEDHWTAHTYVWNADQTDAERVIAGRRLTLQIVDDDGNIDEQVYLVPNTNQCRDCHARDDVTVILGFNSVQLDYTVGGVNELDRLHAAGLFTERPTRSADALVDPIDGSASLNDRARSYLHANCSHCHRPGGDGGRSGLDLRAWQEEPARYGVCKSPVAAGTGAGGRSFDIVPGHPEDSILPFRMASTDPEIRMPELPSRLPDDFGVDLISEWIRVLPGERCR